MALMPQPALVALAKRLVDLDAEAASVRAEMLRLLSANGADRDPPPVVPPPRPTQGRPARKPPPFDRVKAMEAEQAIVALLKSNTPMSTGGIVRATGAHKATVQDRLKRLQAKGLVARGDTGGWTATAL